MATEPEILNPGEESALTIIGGMDALTRSEINMQVEFAMAHPRSIEKVRKDVESLVTLNQSIAEESFYTLKRKNKDGTVKLIQGPSIRFAEVLCYCWGHVRWGKQIAEIDNEFVTGEGVFMDLQRNNVGKVKTKRRIVDSYGHRYNTDMIQVTGNAAASLAYRNAVTGTIPQAFWKDILEKAKLTAIGGTQSIAEKRTAAIQYGAKIGVSEDRIYATLGIQGINDLGVEELIALRGLFNSLKDGETTIEEAFGDPFEEEITSLYEKLGYNQARRTAVSREYKTRSVELLAYLRKQAEPLGNTSSVKPASTQASSTTEQASKAEESTEQAKSDAPQETGEKRKPGRPKKSASAQQETESKPDTQAETQAQSEQAAQEEKPEQTTTNVVPEAGRFSF
jgi:hypothetical protein